MPSPSDLTGARCLVTGATGALGGAVAHALYARGADLILTGRSSLELSKLLDSLQKTRAGRIEGISLDLTLPDATERLLQATGGQLDILVNNAAIQGPIGPFTSTDWVQWQHALQFDLVAPIALTHALLGLLVTRQASKGHHSKIIMVSGGGATAPRPNFSAYAVAKTGLVRFAECLAHELKDSGVDVNAVAPGAMPSAMTRQILQAGSAAAVGNEQTTAAKALGPSGAETLSRAAELIAYLASPESDDITGRLISAVWDPWPKLAQRSDQLATSDIFTLRRIVPPDRGQNWE